MDVLEADLAQKNLLPPSKIPKLLETETRAYHYRKGRNAILDELKSHTRSVEDADPMLTQRVSSMYDSPMIVWLTCLGHQHLMSAQLRRQLFNDSTRSFEVFGQRDAVGSAYKADVCRSWVCA